MAVYELNVYGQNDEVLKTFATDKVRWGVFIQAFEVHEKTKDKPAHEKMLVVNALMKKLFPDLTDADLENADIDDVMNVFLQLLSKAKNIGGGGTLKNAEGEG